MDKQSLHETAKRLALELPFVDQVTPAMARTFLHDTPQSVVRGNAKPVRHDRHVF